MSDSKPEVDSSANAEPTSSEAPTLSKNQLKKLERKLKWQETLADRRKKEKEKRKQKMKHAKDNGIKLGPSRKELKARKMADSNCKLKVCFDLSLSNLMTESEVSKTFKQLHRCYSINRRAEAPLQLYLAGYSDELKETMNKAYNCFNWDVNLDHSPYHKLFKAEDIVYLTSDSPNVIEDFDHSKVYIIGALVDHNRLKNVCFKKAEEHLVAHARLPLDVYFHFKTRKVLTIDQVYTLILEVAEGKSWEEAVMKVVPKRKGVKLIDSDSKETENLSVESSKSDD